MMKNIPIDSANEKMILAKDIAHPGGSDRLPICRKGTGLTSVLIKRLTGMGIETLAVEEDTDDPEEANDLQEELDALAFRFKHLDGNPRMCKLKEIMEKNLIRAMENDHGQTTE